ncbi:hypothetical protein [uncultured Dysosmobacter sp.]|uniref:hypothetical protein n=1 Tax=uncultured Dysosmobacter sp. TaxID=2591384 RepID=UPI00261D62BB|nr:hypothetical protein [uncultured Dysosmobacter sp.]
MRTKTKFYLVLWILGAVMMGVSLLMEETLPRTAGGMLTGAGAGLLGFGFSNWRMRRWEEKEPKKMRMAEIEAGDERNIAIRRRAQAVSGEVLQWALMAGAWLSIGLGAPLWVTLLAVGAFLMKCVLELCLMARYQREM